MNAAKAEWYIKKKNNALYGPVSMQELVVWAQQCRVVAGNQASCDQENWTPVEEIPELEMHWLAKRTDGKQYGPFPLSAIPELVKHNVLPGDAVFTHRKSNQLLTMEEALAKLVMPNHKETPTTKEPDEPEEDAKEEAAEEPKLEQDTTTESGDLLENIDQDDDSDEAETEPQDEEYDDGLAAELQAAKEEIGELRSEMEQLEQNIDALQKQTRELKLQNKALQETAKTECQELAEDAERTREEVIKLQRQLETSKEQAIEKQQELETRISELEDSLADAHAQNQTHAQQNSNHQVALTELRQQVAFTKKNISALNAQLQTARNTADQRGKMLSVAWVIVTILLAALIMSLLSRGCSKTEPKTNEASETDQTTLNQDTSETLQPMENENALPNHAASGNIATGESNTVAPLQIASPDASIQPHTDGSLTIIFSESIFSSLDSLSGSGKERLDDIARQLPDKLEGWRMIIQGHTDDTPMRNTTRFANNKALALARAQAAAKHFMQRAGFPANAISPQAGTEAPYPNDTNENRVRNRTVTIHLERTDN